MGFVTPPFIGLVSDFDYETFAIGSVCVTFFASEGEASDEAVLEGFNRGYIVTYNNRSDQSIRVGNANTTWAE